MASSQPLSAATSPDAASAAPVIEPVSTKSQLRDFLHFPWQIYTRNSPWVPPLLSDVKELLDPKRHPFHQHAQVQLFLARREGKVVGRVAAIINQAHLDIHKDGTGFFGFFEAIDDTEVAGTLLDAASTWLKSRRMVAMRGPVSPSVNEEAGLLLNDFEGRPVLMMTYNPPYYARLLEANGLVKVRELGAFLVDMNGLGLAEDEIRRSERIRARYGITVRNARLKNLEQEVEIIESIYNRAWKDLWGFVPLMREEAAYMARKLKSIVDERIVTIGYVHGEPVAFALALPDYNVVLAHLNGRLGPLQLFKALYYRSRIRRIRLLALGVAEEHRNRGIESIMMLELIRRALAAGYEDMEISWILEDNEPAMRVMQKWRLPRYRTYGIFERSLIPASTEP